MNKKNNILCGKNCGIYRNIEWMFNASCIYAFIKTAPFYGMATAFVADGTYREYLYSDHTIFFVF